MKMTKDDPEMIQNLDMLLDFDTLAEEGTISFWDSIQSDELLLPANKTANPVQHKTKDSYEK